MLVFGRVLDSSMTLTSPAAHSNDRLPHNESSSPNSRVSRQEICLSRFSRHFFKERVVGRVRNQRLIAYLAGAGRCRSADCVEPLNIRGVGQVARPEGYLFGG